LRRTTICKYARPHITKHQTIDQVPHSARTTPGIQRLSEEPMIHHVERRPKIEEDHRLDPFPVEEDVEQGRMRQRRVRAPKARLCGVDSCPALFTVVVELLQEQAFEDLPERTD
jgi:hypothetical protein